jgi:hypothetical protein
MANRKISEFTLLTSGQVSAADDYLPIVDPSEATAASRNKRITVAELAIVIYAQAVGGNLLFAPDNTYDIGASGASRPRDLFVARNIYTDDFVSITAPSIALYLTRSGGGDRGRFIPQAAGGGFTVDVVDSASTDYEPFDLFAEVITFRTRTGAGTAATALYVDSVASAVNFISVAPAAAGGAPALYVAGSSSDITLRLSAKGGNGIDFYTSGFTALQAVVVHTASADRYITLTGSNGGNPTIGTSAGNLAISTSLIGSGELRSSVSQANFAGFVSAGTSGNFQAGINGSAAVVFSSSGNLKLQVDTVGTSTGGDIQWGKPNVALGGGAAPTVGTIGGSGPAAAAQRNWLRFIESDGTASFIPVWR